MPGYFFKYVAPKIAKNLTQRRKVKDEAFKSIDEKGKGLSLQKRSNIKKSFSGKASKIFDDASKARKGKMNGGTMDEKNRKEIQKQKVKLGLGVFDEKGNFQAKKRKKMMGGGMMSRRFGMNKGGKVPTTPKEKSLAKLAPPKDKITFGDVIAGRTKGKA